MGRADAVTSAEVGGEGTDTEAFRHSPAVEKSGSRCSLSSFQKQPALCIAALLPFRTIQASAASRSLSHAKKKVFHLSNLIQLLYLMQFWRAFTNM